MSLVLPFIRIHPSEFGNMVFCVLGLVFVIMLSCLIQTSQVYGHAFVIGSTPSPSQNLKAPPAKIEVHLSEPVDLKYSKLSVIGPDGKNEIDNKDMNYVNGDQTTLSVSLPRQGLKDGVYTVTTRMLSQVDGHVTDNAFVFGVGEGAASKTSQFVSTKNILSSSSAQLSIPDVVARFPTLVGQVMIVGAAFTTLWLWRPYSKLTLLQTQTAFLQTRTKIDRSLVNLMLIGSIILVLSDFGMIFVQAYSINASILDAIGTKFGTVWIVRVVVSLMILGFVMIMRRRLKREDSMKPSQKSILFVLVLGLGTLLTTSLIGHGAAITSGNIVPITLDFIHNLAASFWVGGVIYLALVVVPKIRQAKNLEEDVKASVLSIMIPRFSIIPIVVLGTIVITGPFLLFILEDNLHLILASVYGKALIAKLVFASVMLGIGAYNQTVIHRRAPIVSTTERSRTSLDLLLVTKGLDTEKPIPKNDKTRRKRKSAVLMFNRSIKAEAVVGLMLLLAVAVMVNTGLPKSEFQSQLQQQQQQQLGQAGIPIILPLENSAGTNKGFTYTKFLENGSRVLLTIEPYSLGNNHFKISFLDQNKNPTDMKSVELKLTQTEQGIGPIQVDARQVSKGIFTANTAFGIAGEWDVLVEGFQKKEGALNLVATYNLFVKPSLDQITYSVRQIKTPYNNSQPLYPIYDKTKNVIWVGDTSINSGRIVEYNINNGTYSAHRINGTNIITQIALDSSNTLWYIDPITKVLGHYNPDTDIHQSYNLPKDVIPSGIAFDSINSNTKNTTENVIWITSSSTNEILRFDITSDKFLTPLQLPTPNASPLGITVDPISGQIWVAESSIGKIANIDPTTNKIIEYSPGVGKNNTLIDPTSIITDPFNGNVYISEHEGHTVSVFNPLLKTFNRFPTIDSNGLPFGMALDNDRNLWVAEHVINKIAVLDTSTGEHKEVDIPTSNPSFIQWLTSDSKGNVWYAEQRGNSIGFITSAANPLQTGATLGTNNNSDNQTQISGDANSGNSSNSGSSITNDFLTQYGLNYVHIVGPMVAVGIVLSAILYTRSVNELKRSVNQINK